MKAVINTIIFNNNVVIINHVHNYEMNEYNDDITSTKVDQEDQRNSKFGIVIEDKNDHPLIAQLEKRISEQEQENQVIINRLSKNNE